MNYTPFNFLVSLVNLLRNLFDTVSYLFSVRVTYICSPQSILAVINPERHCLMGNWTSPKLIRLISAKQLNTVAYLCQRLPRGSLQITVPILPGASGKMHNEMNTDQMCSNEAEPGVAGSSGMWRCIRNKLYHQRGPFCNLHGVSLSQCTNRVQVVLHTFAVAITRDLCSSSGDNHRGQYNFPKDPV